MANEQVADQATEDSFRSMLETWFLTSEQRMTTDNWHGCYREGWKEIITEESFAHPAKVSYSLAERIYQHMALEDWIHPGSRVLDPFGGIGGFALGAVLQGCHFVGCELELKFCDMAQGLDCPGFTRAEFARLYGRTERLNGTRNFHWCPICLQALSHPTIATDSLWVAPGRKIPERPPHHYPGNLEIWQRKFKILHISGPGSAVMLHGDSRRLKDVIAGQFDAVVSSPPFMEQQTGAGLAKPDAVHRDTGRSLGKNIGYQNQGQTVGNLAVLPGGDFSAVVSSPPYASGTLSPSDGIDWEKAKTHDSTGIRHQAKGRSASGDYGKTPGQLDNMKGGDFDAVISSPPYERSLASTSCGIDWGKIKAERARYSTCIEGNKRMAQGYSPADTNLGNMKGGDFDAVVSSPPYEGSLANNGQHGIVSENRDRSQECSNAGANAYGEGKDNLGNSTGPTFWSASKEILQQCYDLLAPGGHAVWVVKSFVRKGKIVDFPGQWRQLCESVGFTTLHEHHAMLVEETEHDTLFNGREVTKKERKSFFRQLHEKKNPTTAIDYETVYCMVKP